MRIYTDSNGSHVNAISTLADNTDVRGHLYHLNFGKYAGQVHFQQGPVKEVGVNGPTNEALLHILINRTEFLDSQFPCEENKKALEHLKAALEAFESRTKNRQDRGVEGTNQL